MHIVSLYFCTGILYSTYVYIFIHTPIFFDMYISIHRICVYWSIFTHEVRLTYVGVWFYTLWNQHSVWTEERHRKTMSIHFPCFVTCNSWRHAFATEAQISTSFVLMDRMARKKERHNVSNLFDSVCACKAFFDRVVPTIHVVGGVYQTYIIYYESYLYIYYVNRMDFTRVYIYIHVNVCVYTSLFNYTYFRDQM